MNDGIGPPGNHLRWSLPKELSFPEVGFYIFRKHSSWKVPIEVVIPTANFADDAPSEFQVGGIEFFRNTSSQLDLQFPEPLAGLQLTFDSATSIRLRAYKENQLIADLTSTSTTVSISCAFITRLIVDCESHLRLVEYVTNDEVIHDDNWQFLKHVRPPRNFNEALGLFEDGLYNHYVSREDDVRDRYKESAKEIVEWFEKMFAPTLDRDWRSLFMDWTQPANLLKLYKSEPHRASVSANLQSIFLLAALDPNLARLMGLYYVDVFGVTPNKDVEKATPKQFYDYKIYGDWGKRLEHCGLLLNLGYPRGDKPSVTGPLTVHQVAGLHWRDPVPDELRDVEADLPLGRLGLTWPKPVWNGDAGTRAVQPVLYELTKKFEQGEENSELILVGARSWAKKKPAYVDANLRLGTYHYAIRPIDLFGQIGTAIESEPFELKDLDAPPPPVRVRAQPSSDNASLAVQFEYGASQHQQARDVKEFSLYWREDSLLKRRAVEVLEVIHFPYESQTRNKLRLRNADGTSISQPDLVNFIGDVLTNVLSNAEPFPAIDRRRYRIAQVDDQGWLITEKTTTAMSRGTYELVSDPHNKSTWKKLSQSVAWREPIRSTLRSSSDGLSAEVKKVIAQSVPAPNPFAQVPVAARGSQAPQLAPSASLVELEIDRVLTEPDVFIDGAALINDQQPSIGIEYVVSNLPASSAGSGLSSYPTRIGLTSGTTVNVGDRLKLLPAGSFTDRVRQIEINGTVDQEILQISGGEIAFGRQIDGRPVLTVMRVISNAVNVNGRFDLLVRAGTATDAEELHVDQRIRYYAPFVINVPMTLASGSPTAAADGSVEAISLPLQDGDGNRQGFVAVTSSDLRRNEGPDARDNEGPLSTAAQFFVVRPKPMGTPSPPYPCGLTAGALAGYASPPDRAGRATTCLKWDVGTLLPATGFRWEVARVLDVSIPAVHLREWQKGNKPVVAPVIEGGQIEGVVLTSSVDDKTGLITVTFHPDNPVANPEAYRNGRLSILPVHFHVTLAQTSGADLILLLRQVTNSSLLFPVRATLHAPPDYSQVVGHHENLRTLAANLPEAFSLVTGVPIDPVITAGTVENRFRDDVPGKGRNAFFYRVRAIDAAENRSIWSQVSVPFHQVDTTSPEAIRLEQPLLDNLTGTLVWARPTDSSITEYRIFRSEGDRPRLNDSALDSPWRVVQIADIRPLALRNVGGSVVLPNVPVKFSNSLSDQEIGSVLAGITVVRIANHDTNGENLFNPKIGRIVFRRATNSEPESTVLVTSISGLAITPPGSALVVEIGNTVVTGNPSFSTWMDSGLVGGEKYSYSVMPVKVVMAVGNGGVSVRLTVPGRASEPVSVVGLDLSLLSAPLFVFAGWVDAEGRPAVVSGEGLRVKLRISVTGASGIRIQKAAGFDESWTNPLINGGRGWLAIEAGGREMEFFDETADPDHQWLYRIQARSTDGRLSNFTDPLLVLPV